jgi:acyl dehydratase
MSVTTITNRLTLSSLSIGSKGSVRKTITSADIDAYSKLLGDSNEIHKIPSISELSIGYNRNELFGGRQVAHGMLSAGLIPTIFGSQIPGSLYVSQTLCFRKPVFAGDTVEASVIVTSIRKNLITCSTLVTRNDGEVVIQGDAKVLLPRNNSTNNSLIPRDDSTNNNATCPTSTSTELSTPVLH